MADMSLEGGLKGFEVNYKHLKSMEQIGKGSFGMVYKAKWRGTTVGNSHHRSSDLTAVKMLHEDLIVDESAMNDFKSEAKLLAHLRPHVGEQ